MAVFNTREPTLISTFLLSLPWAHISGILCGPTFNFEALNKNRYSRASNPEEPNFRPKPHIQHLPATACIEPATVKRLFRLILRKHGLIMDRTNVTLINASPITKNTSAIFQNVGKKSDSWSKLVTNGAQLSAWNWSI